MTNSYYRGKHMIFKEIFDKARNHPAMPELERLTKNGAFPGGLSAKIPYYTVQIVLGKATADEIFEGVL